MGVEFRLCVPAVLQSQLRSALQSLSPQVRIPFPTRIARPSARMVRQISTDPRSSPLFAMALGFRYRSRAAEPVVEVQVGALNGAFTQHRPRPAEPRRNRNRPLSQPIGLLRSGEPAGVPT